MFDAEAALVLGAAANGSAWRRRPQAVSFMSHHCTTARNAFVNELCDALEGVVQCVALARCPKKLRRDPVREPRKKRGATDCFDPGYLDRAVARFSLSTPPAAPAQDAPPNSFCAPARFSCFPAAFRRKHTP